MLKMMKAAQWSTPEIKSKSSIPADQPISGIMAWNAPKDVAIFKATLFVCIPLAIDTLKASNARLMAMAKRVNTSIFA